MTALRDLLEVFGTLDKAAGQSGNPAVSNVVDNFLPGFSANGGWYDEIETYFFGENARRHPDLGEACSRIGKATADDRTRLTAPQKSRLLYGLAAATQVHQVAATDAATNRTMSNLTAMDDEYLMYGYIDALAACAPGDQDYETRVAHAGAQFENYWYETQRGCTGRDQFERFRAYEAERARVVDPATLDIPLCDSRVINTAEGIPAVVVDTNIHSPHRTFNEVKEIVNPFNWDENYRDFFIKMGPCSGPERPDGWFRVLETVGFRGFDSTTLTTALKYFVTEDKDEGVARIDYDLDDPTPGEGDGKVRVDRGFINIWVDNADKDPDRPGMRARTRKVVHIDGLSPYAQQRLVCLTGYGTASSEFILAQVADPPPNYPRPFRYYKDDVAQADPDSGSNEMSTHVVATAVNLWTESAQGLVSDYFDMAEKWMDGRLQTTDVADFSTRVTGRLLKAPWEFLERVNQPRHPRGRRSPAQQEGEL